MMLAQWCLQQGRTQTAIKDVTGIGLARLLYGCFGLTFNVGRGVPRMIAIPETKIERLNWLDDAGMMLEEKNGIGNL
jgi:hypothetical protein